MENWGETWPLQLLASELRSLAMSAERELEGVGDDKFPETRRFVEVAQKVAEHCSCVIAVSQQNICVLNPLLAAQLRNAEGYAAELGVEGGRAQAIVKALVKQSMSYMEQVQQNVKACDSATRQLLLNVETTAGSRMYKRLKRDHSVGGM